MPELPEIETIRNGLRRFILNKEIFSFDVVDKKIFLNDIFYKKIKNDSFWEIDRLGKLLVFNFKKNSCKLLIHLKMTGQLIFCSKKKILNKVVLMGGHSDKASTNLNCQNLKYIRFNINFKNGDKLFLNDARRFAYVKIVDPGEFIEIKKKFGVEPLSPDFSKIIFFKLLTKRENKNIKAFLLDQKLIAGIGNIYADEILFASQISPIRKVSSLKSEEKNILFLNIKKILKLAVEKRGTTFSDYVDVYGRSGGFLKLLKVYGRDGEKCLKCKGHIKKIKIAGRGTHYCPICQR